MILGDLHSCELIAKKYNDDPDKMLLDAISKYGISGYGKLNLPLLYFIFRQLPGIEPKKASMLSMDLTWDKHSYLEGVRERFRGQGANFTYSFLRDPSVLHMLPIFHRRWDCPGG